MRVSGYRSLYLTPHRLWRLCSPRREAARLSSMSASAVGFDPASRGTPDSAWRAALASCPAWAPRIGDLVVVSPHPDDETLGAGGLIHTWSRLGHQVSIVSVTDGEAAYPEWPHLDEVRHHELQAALAILGQGRLRKLRLSIPDGQARRYIDRIQQAVEEIIDGPATLVCPYEHDGHPDHEAVAEACRRAADNLRVPVALYPVWMWHQRHPSAIEHLRCGRFWLDHAAEAAKWNALRCFGSQTRPARRSPIIPPHVLQHFSRPYEVFLV